MNTDKKEYINIALGDINKDFLIYKKEIILGKIAIWQNVLYKNKNIWNNNSSLSLRWLEYDTYSAFTKREEEIYKNIIIHCTK